MKDTIQKYHLIPFLSLLLVLIFFYFPVLFFGRTLQGPEMAHMNQQLKAPPSPADIFQGKVGPQIFNTEQATAAYQRFPNDMLLGKMTRALELPLWNSHQGLGVPFAAQYETSAFFPLRIVQDLFPASARDCFFILHMWLAGIFTYLFFVCGSKVNRVSAFFGACLYMGSGTFSWFMQMQDYMGTAMMLPLLMLSTHLLSEKNTAKRVAFVAVASALTLLAGQPEVAFYCFVLSCTYYLFKVYSTEIESVTRAKHLITFFVATILGVMLSSPLLLLFFELLSHAFTIHSADLHSDPAMVAGLKARTPLFLLPAIFLPSLLDFPIMPLTIPAAGSWDFLGSYIGIIPVYFWFAGLSLKHTTLKKDFVFFTLFAAAFLLMDLGYWPFDLIGYLPLFRQAWSPRWGGAVWSYSLIAAATYGFYLLQTANIDSEKWKKLLKQTMIFTGIALYACFAIAYRNNTLENPYIFIVKNFHQPVPMLFITTVFSIVCLGFIYRILLKQTETRRWIPILFITIISLWYYLPKGNLVISTSSSISTDTNFFLTKLIFLILSLSFLGCVFIYLKKNLRLSILFGLLVFLISIFYSIIALPGYPFRETTDKPTAFINYLHEQTGYHRVFAFNGIAMPMYASAYGLYDPRFMTALSYLPYQYFVEAYIKAQESNDSRHWYDANQHANIFNANNFDRPIQAQKDFAKAMNFTGVKYFITKNKEDLNWISQNYPTWAPQLKLAYSDNDVNIFENTTVLPRVFLVSKYTYADNYKKAQGIAMSQDFDLLHIAVLEKNIPSAANTLTLIGNATIQKYSDSKVVIQTDSNENVLLVLTDVDYPGWQVFVDNKKSEILNVDGLVRGVMVGAGHHEVVFNYYPEIFQWAIVFFITALSVCLILFLIEA